MKLLTKFSVPLILILIAVLGVLSLLRVADEKSHPPGAVHFEEGVVLPDFSFKELGGPKRVLSDVQGKVTLINFWATWCSPCISEMPSIIELKKKYESRGLNVIFISVDENAEEVVPGTLASLQIGFPTYHDQNDALAELFDISGIPVTVLVDQNRKILFVERGDRDWNSEDVFKMMDQWL